MQDPKQGCSNSRRTRYSGSIAESNLLKLPLEIRCLIWLYTLSVGTIVPCFWLNIQASRLGVLRVSKRVHDEVKPFLFRNRIHLDSVRSVELLLGYMGLCPGQRLNVKYVSTALTATDFKPEAPAATLDRMRDVMFDEDCRAEGDGPAPRNRYQIAHELGKSELSETWAEKLQLIMDRLSPEHVEIDLRDSYCAPGGCCDMIAMAVVAIEKTFTKYPQARFKLRLTEDDSRDNEDPNFLKGIQRIEKLEKAGCRILPTSAAEMPVNDESQSRLIDMARDEERSLGDYA